MPKIAVVTDSVCNLPPEVAAEHGIAVVPIYLNWDGRSYRDGVDITTDEVYQRLRSSPTLPTSAAPSAGDFVQTYIELSRHAEGIVSVHVLKTLSSTFQAAQIAADMVKDVVPVRVVDTGMAAMAAGFVVLAAARAANAGAGMEEVVRAAESVKSRVHLYAALDTLTYLHRSGRIGRAASLVGNAINIKPIVTIQDGVVELFAKPRTRARAIEVMLERMRELTKGHPVHVAVMHADLPEAAAALRERIAREFECVELLTAAFTPVMGANAGPGLLGIAFYAEE